MNPVGILLPVCLCFLIVIVETLAARKNGLPSSQGTDCSQIKAANADAESGIYWIKPKGIRKPFQVYCDMREDGGWTLIQRHNGNDALSFRRRWSEYRKGFGKPNGEHWLGLQNIYALTNQPRKSSILRVDMGDFEGATAYAVYQNFSISNANDFHRLKIENYSGTAGDAFRGTLPNVNQAGSRFSTIDKDNDQCSPCIYGDIAFNSCSQHISGGGWWFSRCGMADLNGDWHPQGDNIGWQSGVYWRTWKRVVPYSLKYSEMKVKSL